jgi:hypothetical protein
MNDYCSETIDRLGSRSSLMVYVTTIGFALFGAGMLFVDHLGKFPFPLLEAAWIPLCFLIIPPVHALCRDFVSLQRRVRELEKQLQQK